LKSSLKFYYLLKGVPETLARTTLDLAQRFFSRGNSFGDIVPLRGQKSEPLIGFRKFFQRHHVDGAKVLQPLAQLFHACPLDLQIEFVADDDFAREFFQAMIQFVGARLAHKIYPGVGFGALYFDGRAGVAWRQPRSDSALPTRRPAHPPLARFRQAARWRRQSAVPRGPSLRRLKRPADRSH